MTALDCLAALLAEAGADPQGLTPAGWTVMIVSIGVVVTLVSYCLYRVLTLPPVDIEDIEGPLTIDTGDTRNAD